MLSICIPTYNYDVTPLVSALVSQANGLKYTVEILIRDDHSKHHKITELSFPESTTSIRTFTNTINIGRTATRGALAADARFDHLLFLDADTVPAEDQFLARFEPYFSQDVDVVSGGIAYHEATPAPEYRLRWRFGHEREARKASERQHHPYLIVSGSLWIKKVLFININPKEQNAYGLDNLISNRLRARQSKVIHIDNPVYHLGLESNTAFLEKSLKAVDTLFESEQSDPSLTKHTRLQQQYERYRSTGLMTVFYILIDPWISRLKRKTVSAHPSLRAFDFIRLHQYIKRKRNG
jgi:glycosyltransferase involved in cell wall biosynthesis